MKYLLILLLILGLGVGYYILQKQNVTPSAESPISLPEESEADSGDSFTVDGENWQRVTDAETGIQFAYRTNPDGYRLETHEASENNGPLFVKGYVLMLEEDLASLQESDIPREGPPTINVSIYKNENNMFPSGWAEAYPQYSNINLALTEIGSNPVAGAQAIRYRADGLYVSENIVIANGGYIYVVSGAFMDEESIIRKDFDPFVRSITFVPTDSQE